MSTRRVAFAAPGDKFEVIGDGQAAITDGKDHEGISYYFLNQGERFELKKRAKF